MIAWLLVGSLVVVCRAESVVPPPVRVLKNQGRMADGLIFISPQGGTPAGPEIVDNQGRVVWFSPVTAPGGVWAMGGCTPRVEVEVGLSDKPITINLNVKIDHEIRVKIEKELKEVLSEKSGLF